MNMLMHMGTVGLLANANSWILAFRSNSLKGSDVGEMKVYTDSFKLCQETDYRAIEYE